MTTEEKNKLISEFMNMKQHEDYDYLYCRELGSIYSRLQYHSSWDWLMPVVEKINGTNEYDVIIWRNDCHINGREEIIFETNRAKNEELVSVVYRAVVQFIQWFNEKK